MLLSRDTFAGAHVNLPVSLLLPVQIERLFLDLRPMRPAREASGTSILMNTGEAWSQKQIALKKYQEADFQVNYLNLFSFLRPRLVNFALNLLLEGVLKECF